VAALRLAEEASEEEWREEGWTAACAVVLNRAALVARVESLASRSLALKAEELTEHHL
jgi:hypothetical protein